MIKALVWSKQDCRYCTAAKQLLNQLNIEVEERMISDQNTKNQLLQLNPDADTVPQIYIDGKRIGGYDDLVKYIESDQFNDV